MGFWCDFMPKMQVLLPPARHPEDSARTLGSIRLTVSQSSGRQAGRQAGCQKHPIWFFWWQPTSLSDGEPYLCGQRQWSSGRTAADGRPSAGLNPVLDDTYKLKNFKKIFSLKENNLFTTFYYPPKPIFTKELHTSMVGGTFVSGHKAPWVDSRPLVLVATLLGQTTMHTKSLALGQFSIT